MKTIYITIIVIVAVIVIGLLAYIAFAPVLPNCDPTVAYTKLDDTTGAASDGTQCYCSTDTIDTDGKPLASWVQKNNTQFYDCVYA